MAVCPVEEQLVEVVLAMADASPSGYGLLIDVRRHCTSVSEQCLRSAMLLAARRPDATAKARAVLLSAAVWLNTDD